MGPAASALPLTASTQNFRFDKALAHMIVTIDGPAGAGKSTVARALARRLGFRFLDTGAMYRAVALAGMRSGVDWDRPAELSQLVGQLKIQVSGDRILLNGEDVTAAVRSVEVTALTRFAADNPTVRKRLVDLQRLAASDDDLVTEGRDQGTVVFPDAKWKIFLTASAEERARRRLRELAGRGESKPLDEVLADITRRDRQDEQRAVGPLARAVDAVTVSTDRMTIEEVVKQIELMIGAK